ncbi:EamA family transporter [Mycoplasmatota bacterium]|nr:EamA family transporter [Mycoplasmatota bacterium]
MNNKYLPYISGLVFATIFGFSFMFSKIILGHITTMQLLAYRFLIAFIVFEVLRLLKIIKINFKGKRIMLLFYTALFQPVLYFILETYGLSLTQSSEAGMMIALIPIFVTILSAIFLNEKPTKLQLITILISVSGVFYINLMRQSSGEEVNYLGLILLLGAVISAAIFNTLSRRSSREFNSYELTYSMMLSGMIVFNGFAVFQGIAEGNLENYFTPLLNRSIIAPILYLSIVASICGFFLVNYSLSKLEAHVSSIFANIATIVSILAGTIILGESFYYYQIIGSVLIIAGVYGTVKFRRKVNL